MESLLADNAPMPLPNLTALLDLCAQDARCRGLVAYGPALRDYATPAAELGLLLIADDPELQDAGLPLHDRIEPESPEEGPIRLQSIDSTVFASDSEDPWNAEWFLNLGEGVVLYDADGSVSQHQAQALAWNPHRVLRGLLQRTGELVHALDQSERALEEEEFGAALDELVNALTAQRRLELLRAGQHPGSSFWGLPLAHSLAAEHFFALRETPDIGGATIGGIVEELSVALDAALAETFPAFEEVLKVHPAGLSLEGFGYLPAFENLPNFDLLIWRHHRRGALVVRAERQELGDLPGHWTTVIQVTLPAAAE